MAFLDETGLARFLANLKTWFSAHGNAATASKLAAAKTISLTGDVSGSASFDGSANASITATVADDSHNHVISNVDGLQTALNAKATDSGVVHLAGDETVSGAKTLTSQQLAALRFKDGRFSASSLPSSTIYQGIRWLNGDGAEAAEMYRRTNADGSNALVWNVFKADDPSQSQQMTFFNPPASENATDGAYLALFAKLCLGRSDITRLGDDAYLRLCGGVSDVSGAHIVLHGKDHGGYAGYATIRAVSSTESRYFTVRPDGTAEWNGSLLALSGDMAAKGSAPAEIKYARFSVFDSNGEAAATWQFAQRPDGSVDSRMFTYANAAGSTSGAGLVVGYDASGTAYSQAVSTSSARSSGQDIVTRDWIPNDSRIVHSTGDETIGGAKTFTSSPTVERVNPYLTLKETDTARDGTVQTAPYSGFQIYDKNEKIIGGLYALCGDGANRSTLRLRIYDNKSTDAAHDLQFQSNVNGEYYFYSNDDNLVNLGSTYKHWKVVYASTGTINTSDERLKQDIADIQDAALDAWGDVGFCQFRFRDAVAKKGEAARLHSGLIAQRIDEAFKARGLDASQYGLFCHDAWEAEAEQRDADGNVVTPAHGAGDRFSLRYEEALCMEAAFQRRRADRLEARIAALEEKLNG